MNAELSTLISILAIAGICYGGLLVFLNWEETIPPGSESDCEYTHHRHFVV